MKVKTFIFDALGFGFASLLTKGTALIIVPVLTRSLTVDQYGSLEILVGFSAAAGES